MDTHMVLIRLELDARSIKEGSGQQAPVAIVGKQYRWKGTDADLAELIYGLHARRIIEVDSRAAEIKEIAQLFGNWFGRELPNIYYTQTANQRRKKDKTPFLHSLIRVMGEVGNPED